MQICTEYRISSQERCGSTGRGAWNHLVPDASSFQKHGSQTPEVQFSRTMAKSLQGVVKVSPQLERLWMPKP